MPKKPKLQKGARIDSIEDLIPVLYTEPSVWWLHQVVSCAFVRNIPLSRVMYDLSYGNLHRVIRPTKEEV